MPPRVYVPPEAWSAENCVLSADAAHHLTRVLRLADGAEVEVFDGVGGVASATLCQVGKREWVAVPGERVVVKRPVPEVVLALALIRPQHMEFVLRKATELGVTVIQPVLTARCVARTRERPERWMKTVISAAEQCGQNWFPRVEPVRAWTDWVTMPTDDECRVIGSLESGAQPFRAVLRHASNPARVTLAVGPEGDFTEAEYARARAHGFQPVRLGDLVLRVETAALMLVAGVRYEYG